MNCHREKYTHPTTLSTTIEPPRHLIQKVVGVRTYAPRKSRCTDTVNNKNLLSSKTSYALDPSFTKPVERSTTRPDGPLPAIETRPVLHRSRHPVDRISTNPSFVLPLSTHYLSRRPYNRVPVSSSPPYLLPHLSSRNAERPVSSTMTRISGMSSRHTEPLRRPTYGRQMLTIWELAMIHNKQSATNMQQFHTAHAMSQPLRSQHHNARIETLASSIHRPCSETPSPQRTSDIPLTPYSRTITNQVCTSTATHHTC